MHFDDTDLCLVLSSCNIVNYFRRDHRILMSVSASYIDGQTVQCYKLQILWNRMCVTKLFHTPSRLDCVLTASARRGKHEVSSVVMASKRVNHWAYILHRFRIRAISHPDIIVEHCDYCYSVATLLKPCGVATVSHKYNLICNMQL
jgi:hypothetical protein